MKQLEYTLRHGDAAHEDFERAKALDFALAVVGHELGAAERQQAMATLDVASGRPACPCGTFLRD
jgi:hypothetical protein